MTMLIPKDARTIDEFLQCGPYVSYTYSYPHKTAYRVFEQPRELDAIWRHECVDSLFLYVHIPFCEMRCGFCNLFTYSQPSEEFAARFLEALERQAWVLRERIPQAVFSRLAIGGGTPSFLSVPQLRRLFLMLSNRHGIDGATIPISFEVSPATVDNEKLSCLRSFGINRISIGVQSFDKGDVRAIGRPQDLDNLARSLEMIAAHRFSTLNLDLIYGGHASTVESWMRSLSQALSYSPDEIYLYPLYVRPLTGLARVAERDRDVRLECYRAARAKLLACGYEQVSMRNFRRRAEADLVAPIYRCQEDGMIGMGCGARSYTQSLHYADRFAVKQASVAAIVRQFIDRDQTEMALVRHGIELDLEERRRRFLIKSLLQVEGVDRCRYRSCFGNDVTEEFSEIAELQRHGLVKMDSGRVRLTETGLENSDAIGPWLYSDGVRRKMEAFSWNLA